MHVLISIVSITVFNVPILSIINHLWHAFEFTRIIYITVLLFNNIQYFSSEYEQQTQMYNESVN